MEFFKYFFIQIFFIFIIFFIFGFIIKYCSKVINYFIGRKSYKVIALIGTPIHELGHALFCLLFFHKITKIELYTPNNPNHLGLVQHSYNKKNIYHQIGNYFIGIGPILFGSIILSFFLFITQKELYLSFLNSVLENSNINNIVYSLFILIKEIILNFNLLTLLFIIIGFCICNHMSLSKADISSSFIGLLYILIILVIINILLYFININLLIYFTNIITFIGSIILSILSISLFFCLIELLLSLFIYIIRKFLP